MSKSSFIKRVLLAGLFIGVAQGLLALTVIVLPNVAVLNNLFLHEVGLVASVQSCCTFFMQPALWCVAAFRPSSLPHLSATMRWVCFLLSGIFYGISGAALIGVYWELPDQKVTVPVKATSWQRAKSFLLPIGLFINLVSMMVHVYAVGMIVHLAQLEQRDGYDSIDAVSYFCTSGPTLVLCFLLNLIWGIVALIQIVKRRDYSSAIVLGIAIALWLTVITVARSFT